MKTSKQLNNKSGITIPKQIRAEAGWFPGMAMDVEATSEGVLIKKHVPTCQFCGTIDKVAQVLGIEVCLKCGEKIAEAVSRNE